MSLNGIRLYQSVVCLLTFVQYRNTYRNPLICSNLKIIFSLLIVSDAASNVLLFPQAWCCAGPVLSPLDQLFPIGSVLELSALGCSSTHNTTLKVFQRAFVPAPPKPGPGVVCVNFIEYVKLNTNCTIIQCIIVYLHCRDCSHPDMKKVKFPNVFSLLQSKGR